MRVEYEARVLDINKEKLEQKLISLGAKKLLILIIKEKYMILFLKVIKNG